jgi:hypothetical protein
MSWILHFCQWLQDTWISVAIRESIWSYPIIESIHVLSLCIFLGLLLVWDCRLLGFVMPRVPVSAIWRQLIPWIAFGAVLMMGSGVLLFWSDPVRFYGNIFFRVKTFALVLAVLNAAAFHLGIEKQIAQWDAAPVPPRAARIAGGVSLGLWVLIVISGRLVAYNWFDPLV